MSEKNDDDKRAIREDGDGDSAWLVFDALADTLALSIGALCDKGQAPDDNQT